MKSTKHVTIMTVLFAIVLGACAPAATTAAPTSAPVATTAPTAAPAATEAPTAAASSGSYLDRAMAGEFKGTTVSATGPFVDQDARSSRPPWQISQAKTGITIRYWLEEFEASIKDRNGCWQCPGRCRLPPAWAVGLLRRPGQDH